MAKTKRKLRGRKFSSRIHAVNTPAAQYLDCWAHASLDEDGDIALTQDSKFTWLKVATARRYANYILALCDQEESSNGKD